MEKIYHIYAKNTCLFHSLKEEDFQNTWKELNNMVDLVSAEYTVEDLSYEELMVNRESILNSSH